MSKASSGLLPPGVPADYLLNIEVPSLQAKRKVKFNSEQTAKESVQAILRKVPIERIEYLALWVKGSGVWLDEQRKLYTYILENENILELKYRTNDGVNATTVTVCYEGSKMEVVKIYPETTVRGLIQQLELKRHFQFDKYFLHLHNKPLENLDELLSNLGIADGSILEYKMKGTTLESSSTTSTSSVSVQRQGVPMLPGGKSMFAEMQGKQLRKTTASTPPEPAPKQEAPSNELLAALEKRRAGGAAPSTANQQPVVKSSSASSVSNPPAVSNNAPQKPPPATPTAGPRPPSQSLGAGRAVPIIPGKAAITSGPKMHQGRGARSTMEVRAMPSYLKQLEEEEEKKDVQSTDSPTPVAPNTTPAVTPTPATPTPTPTSTSPAIAAPKRSSTRVSSMTFSIDEIQNQLKLMQTPTPEPKSPTNRKSQNLQPQVVKAATEIPPAKQEQPPVTAEPPSASETQHKDNSGPDQWASQLESIEMEVDGFDVLFSGNVDAANELGTRLLGFLYQPSKEAEMEKWLAELGNERLMHLLACLTAAIAPRAE